MNRHGDEASISTTTSLPSLLNIRGDKCALTINDFSHSTPRIYGRKADLWGTSTMPPLPKYRSIFEDSPEEAEFKRQKSLHEEQEKAKVEGDRIRKQSDARVRKNSLLGLGYNYHSQGDLLKPEKKTQPRTLKPAKKVSKHSTTIRKLRPDQKKKNVSTPNENEQQQQQQQQQHQHHNNHQQDSNHAHHSVPKRRHSRIPGPLPRVLQRAKIQRMLNKAQESLHNLVTAGPNGEVKTPIKKTISLKDAGRDVIAGIRYESMNSQTKAGIKNWEKYFGERAKADFYHQYHVARKNLNIYTDKDLPAEKLSPRSRYLRRVTEENLTPMPLLLRKENNPRGIFLGHKGLGDIKMLPVIEVLEDLPTVETIDLSDNRLTDLSLLPLVSKLEKLPHLTALDLSYNKIDDSSELIMEYLKGVRCRLKTLQLDGADVDDFECGNLAQAIMENKSITSLSLANNMIGAAELMNVVDPDLITGPEALGEMLIGNHTITQLDISWNFIRLGSAIQFSESLTINSTLKILKLAYNAFGDLPTQYLGQALKENTGIKYLDISYNSVTPRAATVLANALIQNETLDTLVVDGNVLGTVGAQALVAAVQRASGETRILSVSFKNCDCKMESEGIFNAGSPSGLYRVDLSEPYGQMVAEECMYLANYRAGCTLIRLEYKPKGSEIFTPITLYRAGSKSEAERTKIRNTCVKFAKVILEKSPDKGRQEAIELVKYILEFFDLFPDDETYQLIVDKMYEIHEDRVMVCDPMEYRDMYIGGAIYQIFYAIFQINDIDNSQTMDLEEFIASLLSLGVEFERKYAKKLFKDFDLDRSGTVDSQEFAMIMVNEFCRTDVPRGELLDSNTKKPWPIPVTGELIIEVFYQCELANIYDVSHDEGILSVIKAIHDSPTAEQREVVFEHATSSPYYFMSAQQALMLFEEMGKHNNSHLDVLSRVLPQLVSSEQCHRFIDSVLNNEGKFALRVMMRQVYNVLMGLPTGHFTFDLRNKQDQIEGRALSAVWAEEMKYMKKFNCDTSQRGNYSNFRNESYNGTPIALTAYWFAACPKAGIVRCDYVSTIRPKLGLWALSDKRYYAMKEMLNLEIVMEKYRDKNWLKNSTLEEMVPSSLTFAAIREHHIEYIDSCHHYHSIYPEERQRDVSRETYDPNNRPVTPPSLRDVDEKPSSSKIHLIYPLAYYKIIQLELLLPIIYLSTEQAIDIINHFPPDNYLRVQVFISMFSRIVDYDKNGVRIFSMFSLDETAEIFHRLGVLNVLDPLYPDRLYRFDLRRWEHREYCKIMIKLAMEEPGENWVGEEYRWSKYDGNVPGWTLPVNWTLPDEDNNGDGGPRKFGWVCFSYTSTNVGCAPVKSVRIELRKKVLCGIKRTN